MSATQDPSISDIHQHPTSVAETLSVTTSETVVPSSIVQHVGGVSLSSEVPVSPISLQQPLTVNVTVPNDQAQQQSLPTGESHSSVSGSIADRASTALLNIASNSLNLTEILNAQQQALEQFQCQLQLAQQTEAINQRLDTIERTLNSLIQQKVQEDAVKSQVQLHHPPQPHMVQLDALSPVTPIRPSQTLQLSTPDKLDGLSDHSMLSEGRKKKLPRELCSKVRSTYHSLNLEFKIDERFLSPANQRVTDTLIDTVFTDSNGGYSAKDIKRSVHRYYESRRRLGIEDLPDRQGKAAEQKRRRKHRARQQRAFDRRKKFVRESETQYWQYVNPSCMTEESDSEHGEKIVTHQLLWRSEFLNQFVHKLDSRCDKSKKPGTGSTIKRTRQPGLPSTSHPPPNLPQWMIDPSYKLPAPLPGVCINDPTLDSQSTPSVADDVTTYTTLIADVQEVHDESSDFELPETVVA